MRHNRELRREEATEKLREDTRVVQICCFDFFFFFLLIIFFLVVGHGWGVALAQSLAGLILRPALNVALSMGVLCAFFFIIWEP